MDCKREFEKKKLEDEEIKKIIIKKNLSNIMATEISNTIDFYISIGNFYKIAEEMKEADLNTKNSQTASNIIIDKLLRRKSI